MRSTLASQPPANPFLLIPFNPIKHLEVLSTGTLGPRAPLSFHKSSFRLKTTIKNTSGQKRPLWNVYSSDSPGISTMLCGATAQDGPDMSARDTRGEGRRGEERRGTLWGKEEQEVLALSFISSCLGLRSEV